MPADLPTLQRSPMPRQRLSSTGFMERGSETAGSICLDARELHHLAPLFGFLGNEPPKVGGWASEQAAAHLGQLRLDLGIGKAGVDFSAEPVDNVDGRVPGCADAEPDARLVARHELAHGRDVRQRFRARQGRYREAAKFASLDVLAR